MPVPDFSPGEVLSAGAMDQVGLWLVKTQTIGSSAVSSVVVTNCFSSNYNNYLITLSGGTSNADGFGIKMRFNVDTSSVYNWGGSFNTFGGAGFTSTGASSQPDILVGFTGDNNTNMFTAQVFNPNLVARTMVIANSATNQYFYDGAGRVGASGQNTGFTITIDSPATISNGIIRVYGYRN